MTVEVKHPEESRLHDFAHGRLSVGERAEIERHLETCGSCCALLGNRADSRDTLLELARQAAAMETHQGTSGASSIEQPAPNRTI